MRFHRNLSPNVFSGLFLVLEIVAFLQTQAAWALPSFNITMLGFADAEHTRTDGYQNSVALQLTDAGTVVGRSDRYNGGMADMGQSLWYFDGTTTQNMGFVSPEHTRTDGYRNSALLQVTNAGQVVGRSDRYNGGMADMGQSIWYFNGTTTQNMGFVSPEHTRTDGYRNSALLQVAKSGQVVGRSDRYNGGIADMGQSIWYFDGTTTYNMGFVSPEHTRTDGYRNSALLQLNEVGQAVGRSDRYNGGMADMGQSLWYFDGTTSHNIGLVGAEQTRNDGYRNSALIQLNQAGQAVGRSDRYNGASTQKGQDAWFYDPTLDQTFTLRLSSRSDGYSFSTINYLGNDGLTLGTYRLFDNLGNDFGDRAFYFTLSDGAHDLGSLINGTLAANGWDWLATSLRANSINEILGYGKTVSQTGGQMPFFLSRVVPPGDFDGDGVVSASDYVSWRNGLGTTYTQADYNLWRTNFGQTLGSSANSIAHVSVPEPKVSSLLLIIATWGLSWHSKDFRRIK